MGRHRQPEIKERLLDACTDYALEHGLPERLEPLASAAGASARMLIYHFGSRNALLRAVLGRARQRQLDTFRDLLRVRPDEPYTATLASAWTSMTGPDGQPYLRMFGQLRENAEQQLWPDFRRAATTDWLGPLERGLASIGRSELATLVLAVIRGLLMDLDATTEITRIDRAFHAFLSTLDHPAGGEHPRDSPSGRAGVDADPEAEQRGGGGVVLPAPLRPRNPAPRRVGPRRSTRRLP